jgi:hypothetical protein
MAKRLRIPAELAVSLVGTSATVALAIGACQDGIPEPVDARRIPTVLHDAASDGRLDDAPLADAPEPADAPPHDALHPPDAPPT